MVFYSLFETPKIETVTYLRLNNFADHLCKQNCKSSRVRKYSRYIHKRKNATEEVESVVKKIKNSLVFRKIKCASGCVVNYVY